MSSPIIETVPGRPATCPDCQATIASVQQSGADARCSCGTVYQTKPRRATPSARQRRAPPKPPAPSDNLRAVLRDLDLIERWEHVARYGSALRVLGQFADDETPVSWADLSDDDREAIMARVRGGLLTTGAKVQRDPDWTRARDLQRRLRAMECTPGLSEQAAILRYLQSHATPEDVHDLSGLYVRTGWTFAAPETQATWRDAGFRPPEEKPEKKRKRAGRPARAVVGVIPLDTVKPEGAGRECVKAATRAWVEGVGECGERCAECPMDKPCAETTPRRPYLESEGTWLRDSEAASIVGACSCTVRRLIADWTMAIASGHGSRVPRIRKRSTYEVEESSLREWDSLRRSGMLAPARTVLIEGVK